MISNYQTLVAHFNKAIGQRMNENGLTISKMKDLRISLIDEEVKETIVAMENNDPVSTIDGLCDVLYVTYGAADVFGVELQTSPSGKDTDIVPTKADWPTIRSSINNLIDAANYAMATIRSYRYESDGSDSRFEDARELRNRLQELADGCWACAERGLGLDLGPFFREVHRTNMWKLKGPKREDGKQLKPADWLPPRITEMLNRIIVGNPASCIHLDNHGVVTKETPHPQGGYFCLDCGGLFVDWKGIA